MDVFRVVDIPNSCSKHSPLSHKFWKSYKKNHRLHPSSFKFFFIRHLEHSPSSDILNILLHPPSWTFFFIRHLEHSSSSAILNILLHPPSWTHPTPWTFSFIRHLEHSLTSDILNILLHPTSWTTKCVLSLEQWTFTSEHHDSILMLIYFYFNLFFLFIFVHFLLTVAKCVKVLLVMVRLGLATPCTRCTLSPLSLYMCSVQCTMYIVYYAWVCSKYFC